MDKELIPNGGKLVSLLEREIREMEDRIKEVRDFSDKLGFSGTEELGQKSCDLYRYVADEIIKGGGLDVHYAKINSGDVDYAIICWTYGQDDFLKRSSPAKFSFIDREGHSYYRGSDEDIAPGPDLGWEILGLYSEAYQKKQEGYELVLIDGKTPGWDFRKILDTDGFFKPD